MSLNAEERNALIILQMEKVDQIMSKMQLYIDGEDWSTLANRLYYAAFHAVSALLLKNKIQVGTHKGAVVMFNLHFVHTGIFQGAEASLFGQLETLRETGDYNCYIQTTREEVISYLEPTKAFIAKIKTLISQQN